MWKWWVREVLLHIYECVVVCIHIADKEPYGSVLTPGKLGGVMVSILAWNARYVGSIPAPGAIFLIFIISTIYIYIYI